MAANITSFVKSQRNLQQFAAVLKSAACEWFLIFLLLIDAVLSYLLTKFAHYCELQIPCILCSRLDHVFGNEKPGFYANLLCSNHRSELSSMFACQIHGKLADGHSMCEECLLSLCSKAKRDPDMHRLLMSKFGLDLSSCLLPDSSPNKESVPGSLGIRLCSCCHKPRRSRQTANRILQIKSPRSGMTRPNIPLPRHFTHRENLKKMRERLSDGSLTPRHLLKCGYDTLSHVGFTELKINSDSESEFPFSDDDEVSGVVDRIEIKEDIKIQHMSEVPPKGPTSDISPEKPTHYSSKPCIQQDACKPQGSTYYTSDTGSRYDPGELKAQQTNQSTYSSALPELISLDEFPPNVMEALSAPQMKQGEAEFPPSQDPNPSALFELLSLVDSSSLNVVGGSSEASQRDPCLSGAGDMRGISTNKHEEVSNSISIAEGDGINSEQGDYDMHPTNTNYVDLSDVAERNFSANEGEASVFKAEKAIVKDPERVDEAAENAEAFSFIAEKYTMKEHDGVNEDLKLLHAEICPHKGHICSNNAIASMHSQSDELQMVDTSVSNKVQMLQNSIPMETTVCSDLALLEENFVSEISGEGTVDRLKRQVEYDQRRINALYEELEQERNASAIAANEAMAMITRLQEEKAALNMEALQYLRMMEEQAEYDVEALEKANDLLAEREKEIQDLETELELFRLNFPSELILETPLESSGSKGTDMNEVNAGIHYAKDDVCTPGSSMFRNFSHGAKKSGIVKKLFSDYDEEKLFISQCLKGLEKKIYKFYHGASPCMSDSDDSEETANGGFSKKESLDMDEPQVHRQIEDNNPPIQKDFPVPNGNLSSRLPNASSCKDKMANNENDHPVCHEKNASTQCKEIDLASLENEITDLNERLEALESDWNFLEHTFNSLQAGKEGVQFVQEIAHQLRELRTIGMRSRHPSVP